MKKFISVLLSVVMMMSVLSVGALAATPKSNGGSAAPLYESTNSIYSLLTIKNNTAECKTTLMLSNGEKWESITQTLERQSSSGNWISTSNSWTKSADGSSIACVFSNSATLSSSGKYRVKSIVVVETSNKKKEIITVYSSTVSA